MKETLKEFDIKYEIINHSLSGKTTLDAKKALSIQTKNILKSLLLKSKKGHYVGIIIQGDQKANIKYIEDYFQHKYKDNRFKKLRMATQDEIYSVLGYKIGGVPPTAFYKKCEVICDNSLLDACFVVGSAGNEHSGLKINPKELKKLYYHWDKITF